MTSSSSTHFSTGVVVREGLDTDYLITYPRVIVASADVYLVQSDYIVAIKPSVALTVYLPTNAQSGTNMVIKDAFGLAVNHNITLATADGSTIDGAASLVVSANYASVSLIYGDGIGWMVI